MRSLITRVILVAALAAGLAACGPKGAKVTAEDMTMGNPNAKVTVIEYASVACPHCAKWNEEVFPAFKAKYIDTGKVKLAFHDFPLSQHANAIPAAEAARCAADQNAFWPMHDLLYAKQAEWENLSPATPQFLAYAGQLKLDTSAFSQCVSSRKYQAEIQKLRDASTKAGVDHTPTFTIDGKPYDAPALRSAIDAALAAKK